MVVAQFGMQLLAMLEVNGLNPEIKSLYYAD